MKRIILINPSKGDSSGINEATMYPPLGLAYLASYLREKSKEKFNIRIIDANINGISNEKLIEEIKKEQPQIIGVHMNIILGGNGIKLVRIIKKRFPLIRVFIGGAVVSSNPKEMLLQSRANVAIIGEGEETFVELCENKEIDKIKGIAYLNGGKVRINKTRPLIQDIDEIPIPAYDLLPDFKQYKSRARETPVATIMTSRGCPYQCTFCNSSVFGKRFRSHSPEYIINHIDILVKKYGIKQIDILDDNFTLDIDRASKILNLITKRKYKIWINLQNGVRADRLTEELVRQMKEADVFKVGIGVESANEEILKSIKKSLNLKDVIQAIEWFKKYDILTIGFFIIGFPNDTEKTINQTIDFAIKANPSMANFSILIPFSGTEIYDYLKSRNLLIGDEIIYDSGFYKKKMYHRCNNITDKQIFKLQKKAYNKFFFRPTKIIDVIFNMRSYNEFKWTVETSFNIFRNILNG